MHDTAGALDKLLAEHPEMDFVQFQLNYDDWESPVVQARKCHEAAMRHHKPIVVMEPLKGGLLANPPPVVRAVFEDAAPDVPLASWGLRYAASHENIITVLSGMSTTGQVRDNVSCMADFRPLNQDELSVIEKAREAIGTIDNIPCTACQYCVGGCPQGIAIPKIFGAYNRRLIFNDVPAARLHYAVEVLGGGKASDCAACGKCEQVCPQHIAIIENLKAIGQELEGLPSPRP
jgi:predicted aldo/keto reductase-like oxidoreductase